MLTRAEVVAFVREARLAVVATANSDGAPEAALVEMAVTEPGELVFNTKTRSRKVRNIGLGSRIAVVVGWSHQVSVQLEGEARPVAGAERADYARVFQQQFPNARVLNDDFTLIVIKPDWLRYYDARPDSFQVLEGMWPV